MVVMTVVMVVLMVMMVMKKIDKLDFIRIKNLCIKEHYQGSQKGAHKMGENTCKSHIS